jgi:S-DNA-T family DNA segregation ATPase FtsK/SpoIIIE
LVSKLKIFGLPVEPFQPNGVEVGPAFARLKVKPLGKTSINQVRNKAKDLMIHLNLQSIPAVGQQPGCIAVDVQLPSRQTLALNSIPAAGGGAVGRPVFPVGQDVSGKDYWLNLADPADCHLLVAGTTGSGKSEFLKAALAGLARQLQPQELQLVLIDPKRVTFNFPGTSPYFHAPVVHTVEEVLPLIKWCLGETERRYALLEAQGKEDVSQLTGGEALPRVVVVFDEFADLMDDKSTRKDLEGLLKRIAAKARAAGVHLILATQRPEAGVVTPLLRSNLPGRIALRVASEADSKLIIKEPDAVYLLGRGDLLWRQGGALQRLQSPWVSREELLQWLRVH